jgi:hypothetical protein
VDVRNHPHYRRVVDAAEARGVITLNRRGFHVPLHAAEVAHEDVDVETDTGPVRRHVLRHGGAELYADVPAARGARAQKLLASADDIECFCSLPLMLDEAEITATLESQLDSYMRERRDFPLEAGAMMLDLGSPVNAIYHAADLEEYAIWSLTHAEIIGRWLDRAMQRLEAVYRFCLERDLADVYFLVGSELAAPPLVSRSTFQQWVVPYETRLIRLVHSYGKHVIQHYHGQIRELLPDFLAMGADGLHTIEAPPVGNCTLSEAFERTEGRITLIGNIQYDDFRSATRVEMIRLVRNALDEAGGRRFILSPSAGPFDPDPPPRLIENYLAFIEAGS